MRGKELLFFICLCAVAACGLDGIAGGNVTQEDVWAGPGSLVAGGGQEQGIGKKVWYAVGVDYPQGYDWRTDDMMGSVRCSLVVFANGVPLMKLPVGDEYEISPDPDMHRVIEGNLYTDYSTDSETVIKRNGEQLIRYPGREMIVDIAVEDDLVYTLGQARDGKGFSFRVNGEELVSRSSGYVFDHLQRTEDGFSFSFCDPIGSGENVIEKYYHYLAGEICQVAVREDIKRVWDIIYHDDKICYLASMVGLPGPVLAVGNELTPLTLPKNTMLKSCRFIPGPSSLYIEGRMFQRRNAVFSAIWKSDELIKVFPYGCTVASECVYEDGLYCVMNASSRIPDGLIYSNDEVFDMPEGYVSMGGCSIVVVDGILYVGLTSVNGDSPAIWVENEMKPLKINGFISHMSAD